MKVLKRKALFVLALMGTMMFLGCWEVPEYTLAINIEPTEGGTVLPNGGTSYNKGAFANLEVEANNSWKFSSWSGPNGNEVVEKEPGKWALLMDADKEITAKFAPLGTDARLASIAVINSSNKALALTPQFNPEKTEYKVTINSTTGQAIIKFRISPIDNNAVAKINGSVVTNGSYTKYYQVTEGDNLFVIEVIAEDQEITKEYSVNIECILCGG